MITSSPLTATAFPKPWAAVGEGWARRVKSASRERMEGLKVQAFRGGTEARRGSIRERRRTLGDPTGWGGWGASTSPATNGSWEHGLGPLVVETTGPRSHPGPTPGWVLGTRLQWLVYVFCIKYVICACGRLANRVAEPYSRTGFATSLAGHAGGATPAGELDRLGTLWQLLGRFVVSREQMRHRTKRPQGGFGPRSWYGGSTARRCNLALDSLACWTPVTQS